jgi:ribosome-binding factor A
MAEKKNIAGKPPSQRQLRVGEMLRHRLSEVLHAADFEAKVLKKANITVTEVRIVTLLNDEVPRLKKISMSGLHLKYTPDFKFAADKSFDQAAAMDELLSSDVVAGDIADLETPDGA